MTHSPLTDPAEPAPTAPAEPAHWADAVREMQRLRRQQAEMDEAADWAAAADLRLLFARRDPGTH